MEQKPRGAMLSRRGFLKAAAATGAAGFAGASLTGIAASAAQAEPAASETLGFTYHNEHCLCNCMLQCTVRDGRLAMIQPRENEDKRFQNVCLKGISEVQNIYGDARIQRPMKRVGERGSGEFEAISWDEAFQMIAENFKAIQDKYGKEALWIQFSTEASQRFPPLLASVLGAQAGGDVDVLAQPFDGDVGHVSFPFRWCRTAGRSGCRPRRCHACRRFRGAA